MTDYLSKVFVSTGGFPTMEIPDLVNSFVQAGIKNIEFSAGIVKSDLPSLLKYFDNLHYLLHNYFPAPKIPFVLNLASLNPLIRERSIAHVKNCLKLSQRIGGRYYAVHSGFLFDPLPNQLGKKFTATKIEKREEVLENFIENINYLGNFAEQLGIKLLIENNVLSIENYKMFEENPLLCCNSEEIRYCLENTQKVGFLLDVGHLKVSANSLDYSYKDELLMLVDHTDAYHLSDNNGSSDDNELIKENSEFWPFISKAGKFYTIEVYNCTPAALRQQVDLVVDKLNGG